MRKCFKPYILGLVIAFVLSGCSSVDVKYLGETLPVNCIYRDSIGSSTDLTLKKVSRTQLVSTATTSLKVNGPLKVHFIDVGQGDSELIQTPDNETMLIDAGTNESTDSLVKYLKSQKVNVIDYLILTHPHEDHIGGADAVIRNFNVTRVYMPKVTTTTETFEDLLYTLKSKGLKGSQPSLGTSFKLGQANFKVLGPINSNPEDLNTYSIVIKLTYGTVSFLFNGDAQVSNEEDMISKGYDLSATILKVGHHGSHTSTSQGFLDAVKPQYAVISCGKGNDYGHPHQETMEKLAAAKISVYRTDECGTIIATTDGKNVRFNVKPGDYVNGDSTGSSTSPGSTKKLVTIPRTHNTDGTNISACLDNTTPTKNTHIKLTVTGPKGVSYTAVCHYKSKDTTYNGKVGSPINIDISRASKGFTVIIDITMAYKGKTYTTQTSFTPR